MLVNYKESILYCNGAQRGGGISVLGGVQASAGWGPEQPALTDLSEQDLRGPFQLELFCDNMICDTGTGPLTLELTFVISSSTNIDIIS